MLISKAMLAARHAASTDKNRYNLNGLHFTGPGKVEAANGHWLIQIKAETSPVDEFPSTDGTPSGLPPMEPFIMPTEMADDIRKAIPKGRNTMPILSNALLDTAHTNANESIRCVTTDLSNTREFRAEKIEGEYPATAQVIPNLEDRKPDFTISLLYLEKAIKAAKEFGLSKSGEAGIYFHPDPEKREMSPIAIKVTNPDEGEMLAVIMPMRS